MDRKVPTQYWITFLGLGFVFLSCHYYPQIRKSVKEGQFLVNLDLCPVRAIVYAYVMLLVFAACSSTNRG